MSREHCSHRVTLIVVPVCYRWPDGARLGDSVRRVTCPSCDKRWAVGLSRAHRSQLLRMRAPGDQRSPYELAPFLLRESP